MKFLSARDILHIHSILIEETGGSHGVRDLGAIQGAVDAIVQKFERKELYPTIPLKAAVYLHRIVMNHPFIDGNKRTGVTTASVFLEDNGYRMTAKKGGYEIFAVDVVTNHMSLEEIAEWLKEHSKKV